MGSEKVSTPCGHDDQAGHAQFAQFGVIAEKGSRPGAEASERECHRAHELGRFKMLQNLLLGERTSENVFLSHLPKDCIGTPISFESQVKTRTGFSS
jgi:hypothetical protein